MHPTTGPVIGSCAPAAPPSRGRRVVDAPIRMFHWLFALSFAGAWLSAESEHWRAMHVTLGYTMAGLLGWRIAYGLVGPRQARLSVLLGKLGGAGAWLRSLRQDGLPVRWRPLQNLAMAGAVAVLLALVAPLALSGYAVHADWGGEWLEELHEFFANALLAVVLAHLATIVLVSVLRRRNQALPMLTGRTPEPGPDLVRRERRFLAAALLAAVLAFGAWQWHEAPGGLLPAANDGATANRGHHDDRD